MKSEDELYSSQFVKSHSDLILSNNDEKGYSMLIYNLHLNPIDFWKDSLSLPIEMSTLSEKTQKVLTTLRTTNPGETITYGKLGEKAGISNSARFVGSCMRKNLTPLIIPCHRVLPASGKLGEYSASGGSLSKSRYLKLEGAEYKS